MSKLTAIIVSILFATSLAIPFAAFAGDPMTKTKAPSTSKKMSDTSAKPKIDGSVASKKPVTATEQALADAKKKAAAGKTPQKKGK